MLPLQREATQLALDQARQGASDTQADRNWMLTRRAMLSGVQDRLVADANTFDARVRRDELAQKAGADAQIAIANALASSSRDLARRGVMPGSGTRKSSRACARASQASCRASPSSPAGHLVHGHSCSP
jgi:putative NIF3 family GTP cyclohydrolase 1 type 2